MSKSSLSTVVSTLVRASMGSSVPGTVTDEELDKHVAELILKEAKQKAEQYLQHGVRAYLPDTGSDNLPRANKRFLSSIIRNTDEHNKAILRAQAEAAQEVRAEREEQERRERRARAKEATEAARTRRLTGSSSRRRDDSWDWWDSRRDSGSKDRRDTDDDHRREGSLRHRKHRSRSKSRERNVRDSERRGHRKRDEGERGESSSRKHRRRTRSRSPGYRREKSRIHEDTHVHGRRKPEDEELRPFRDKGKGIDKPSRTPSLSRATSLVPSRSSDSRAEPTLEDSEVETIGEPSAKRKRSLTPKRPPPSDLSAQFRSRNTAHASPPPPASPTLSEEEDIERLRPRRRRRISPKPPSGTGRTSMSDTRGESRSASPGPSSKMDKYFETSYDPRLDVGPLTIPTIPSTGLINGAEFESWDAMLEIIRQRREDKVEQKRLERLGLLSDKGEKDKERKSRKDSEAWTMDAGVGIMDIKYSKKGAVREWDMGKEGF